MMGLDMYLTKKTYVKNWTHMEPEELHTITITGPLSNSIRPERITFIEEDIAYWRKANAIHAWFVNNCADGVDDCQPVYVSRDNLQKLLGVVNQVLNDVKLIDGELHAGTRWSGGIKEELYEPGKVIANPQVCYDLLPTQSGFFFGGTDYDEWYIKDLKYTRDIITQILHEDVGSGTIYYEASW